jgi:hypothetical protein
MSEKVPERVMERSGCGLWTPDCGLFSYWFPPVVITTSV